MPPSASISRFTSGVSVLVTNSTGSANYLAQVNGKYFAAQVPLTVGDNTITVTATDKNNGKHHATVTVTGTGHTDSVALQAEPNVGIPILKPNGKTLLDVALTTSAALRTVVASYNWDFSGTGSSDLTCYTHPNASVSYEHVGLYLTTVTVEDTSGRQYKDTVIVNVMDRAEMNRFFMQKWDSMKIALSAGNIAGAAGHFYKGVQAVYSQYFSEIESTLPMLADKMGSFKLVKMTDYMAECDLRSTKDGVEYSFQVLFIRDANGEWGILSF